VAEEPVLVLELVPTVEAGSWELERECESPLCGLSLAEKWSQKWASQRAVQVQSPRPVVSSVVASSSAVDWEP
jgi:hypothetical protein